MQTWEKKLFYSVRHFPPSRDWTYAERTENRAVRLSIHQLWLRWPFYSLILDLCTGEGVNLPLVYKCARDLELLQLLHRTNINTDGTINCLHSNAGSVRMWLLKKCPGEYCMMGRTQLWMLPHQLWINLNIYLVSDYVIQRTAWPDDFTRPDNAILDFLHAFRRWPGLRPDIYLGLKW